MKFATPCLTILLFLSACSNNSKSDLTVFEATFNGLEQSSKTIEDISADFRKQLYGRLNDPMTAEKAAVLQPQAERVSELASSVVDYIYKLESQLVEVAGYRLSDKASAFKSGNFKSVNKVFFEQKKGTELLQKLRGFIDSIQSVDVSIGIYYAEMRKETYNYLDSTTDNEMNFSKIYFNDISVAAALSVLAKFENDIRNTESKLISYCYYRSFPMIDRYEAFQTLVGINSSCVKAGDVIEINAGVGSFSVASQPKFTIDGKIISCNENGIIVYKFKSPLKAGKYYKSVKIEYTKPDGTKEVRTKNIEYTVIEPKQNP